MKKLTIAILFAMLATPAKALDNQGAFRLGSHMAKKVCEAVWNGASTQDEALEAAIDSLSPSEMEDMRSIIDFVEQHDEGEVSDAYLYGYGAEIAPCSTAYDKLP